MSVTVKVIFLGLIGFVPSPDGGDMDALLVNPTEVQKSYEAKCPTPPHLPILLLLHGKCESDEGSCYRFPSHLSQQAREMGLGNILPQSPQTAQVGQRIELIWLLHEENIDLSGDEDEKLKLRNPFVLFPGAAPMSARQGTDFDWVPRMKMLTKGRGQISDDCRLANANCPLHARFQFQGGRTGACHVFHDNNAERRVRVFDYNIPGQMSLRRRAVADAVQLEYVEEGRYLVLASESLPGRGRPRARAVLSPEKDGRLTLVVANISPCPRDPIDSSSQHDCHSAHSDVFFRLLKNPNIPPPTRRLNESMKPQVDPGSCEADVTAFANFFLCPRQFPHSITACDGVSFPKPTQ